MDLTCEIPLLVFKKLRTIVNFSYEMQSVNDNKILLRKMLSLCSKYIKKGNGDILILNTICAFQIFNWIGLRNLRKETNSIITCYILYLKRE